MSYHGGPTSPPPYEVMSPVSPAITSPDTHRYQRTPKRRRLGSGDSIDIEPFHSPHRYTPADDLFANATFSSVRDRAEHSPSHMLNLSDPYSMAAWDMDFVWDPIPVTNSSGQNPQSQPQPIQLPNHGDPSPQAHPQFANYYQVAAEQVQQNMQPARNPPDSFWSMPHGVPMAYHQMPVAAYRPMNDAASTNSELPLRMNEHPNWPRHQLPELTAIQRIPPVTARPPRPAPTPPAPRKGGISLCLNRATPAKIEELPEHKRECPACQLEFDTGDYLAVISCCGTAMHAVCLSAWVNSVTYAKTKVCMKCRKLIDARKTLNSIVPPVTDKSWDRGVDFAAPESLKDDTKIEFDVSGRPPSAAHRRHYRQEMAEYYHRRRNAPLIRENEVPAASRMAFREIQAQQKDEMEALELRYRNARSDWRNAFEAEARSADTVSRARERYLSGHGTQAPPSVAVLSDAVKDARKVQEQRHREFKLLSKEYDDMKRKHHAHQLTFLENVMATARDTSSTPSSQEDPA